MEIFKEHIPQKGEIAPQTIAAAGSANSGWIKADEAGRYLTRANLGALGGGTVTLSFEQANTAAGGGAKALAFGGGSSAVNNAQLQSEDDVTKMDHANGFFWFRAKLANVGGTGALCSATVSAMSPRYR